MTDPFAPTATGTASLRFQIGLGEASGAYQYAQINFLITGTVTPGVNGSTFVADSLYPMFYAMSEIVFGVGLVNFTITMNTTAGLKRCSGVTGFGGRVPGQFPSGVCIGLTLYGASRSRRERGIFRVPYATPLLVDGNYVSALFITDSAPLRSWFVTPFTVDGVTFTPAVWSRVAGTFAPIVEVRVVNLVTRLSKRRPQRVKLNPWIAYPDTF